MCDVTQMEGLVDVRRKIAAMVKNLAPQTEGQPSHLGNFVQVHFFVDRVDQLLGGLG